MQYGVTGQHRHGNSEEYILASMGADDSDQITTTTAVSVAFEARNFRIKDVGYEQGGGDMIPGVLKNSRNV
jgi:hypothetical protein